MQRFLKLFAVAIFIIIQTEPGFCQISKTTVFNISVTIPEHVISNNDLAISPVSNHLNQLIQTQTVIRNNKTISLTSIVVP
jgi:hypothetical protein